MGNACACGSGVRPKYKQHVLAVFPKHRQTKAIPAHVLDSHIDVVVKYCMRFPGKLPSVARYLHKRVRLDLAHHKPAHAQIGMRVIGELIEACHSAPTKLDLYDEHVIASCMLCFEYQASIIDVIAKKSQQAIALSGSGQSGKSREKIELQMQTIAADTFIKFIHYHDQYSEYRKLSVFFAPVLAMCSPAEGNVNVSEHQAALHDASRLKGLAALTKMIKFNQERYTLAHFDSILPIILANMYHPGDTEAAQKVRHLARQSLANASELVTVINLSRLLAPIVKWLNDEANQWRPESRAHEILLLVADNSRLHNGFQLCYSLIQCLDECSNRPALIHATAHVVARARFGIGIWQAVVQFLVDRLTIVHAAAPENEDAALGSAITHCVGAYCRRMPHATDYVDVLAIIADRLREHTLDVETTPAATSSLPVVLALLRLATHATHLRRHRFALAGFALPDDVVLTLLAVQERFADNGRVAKLVNRIVQHVVVPVSERSGSGSGGGGGGGGGDNEVDLASVVVDDAESDKRTNALLANLSRASMRIPALLTHQHQEWIHAFEWSVVTNTSSSPSALVDVWRTAVCAASVPSSQTDDLVRLVAMCLALQDHAISSCSTDDNKKEEEEDEQKESVAGRRILTWTAALLLYVSRLLCLSDAKPARMAGSQLQRHVRQVLDTRHAQAQLCGDLDVCADDQEKDEDDDDTVSKDGVGLCVVHRQLEEPAPIQSWALVSRAEVVEICAQLEVDSGDSGVVVDSYNAERVSSDRSTSIAQLLAISRRRSNVGLAARRHSSSFSETRSDLSGLVDLRKIVLEDSSEAANDAGGSDSDSDSDDSDAEFVRELSTANQRGDDIAARSCPAISALRTGFAPNAQDKPTTRSRSLSANQSSTLSFQFPALSSLDRRPQVIH